VNRFWFGTLGNDEVILAAWGEAIEVHCHGGRRVVRWVIEQFTAHGCIETTRTPDPLGQGFELLQRAPTLRTASILLDQLNGAFANEVRRILALLETDPPSAYQPLQQFAELGNTIGQHLVEPWKVVVAGPPNVGKSSLVNALAGYQRSVVSEVAGTTRDAVSVRLAIGGWPVEITDTAGLREALGLEAEGVELATQVQASADVILWVLDLTHPAPVMPVFPEDYLPAQGSFHLIANKCDQEWKWNPEGISGQDCRLRSLPVSAATGAGIPELVQLVAHDLAPELPPGTGIPYTPLLIQLITEAYAVTYSGNCDKVTSLLREALVIAESHHVG
jgi:tRNA modification GTPase